MRNKQHPFISALLSLAFPAITFAVVQFILSRIRALSLGAGGFILLLGIPFLIMPFIGFGSAFAFILGIRAFRSTEKLPFYIKVAVSFVAGIGMILGLAELGYFAHLLNFYI